MLTFKDVGVGGLFKADGSIYLKFSNIASCEAECIRYFPSNRIVELFRAAEDAPDEIHEGI